MNSVETFSTETKEKMVIIGFLSLHVLGILSSIYWWNDFKAIDIVLFFTMYVLTGFGITIGYHRYFTHHSFKCKPWLRNLLLILGSMAGQGPLVYWVATHRRHHRFSDHEGDPHSPLLDKSSWFARVKSFWHAHMGWIFYMAPEDYPTYAADLYRDPHIIKMSYAYLFWLALGLIIPAIIAGLWTQSWTGAWMGFVWGGLVRMAVGQHATWGINSVCHLFGKKNHTAKDNSRDNWLWGIIALGEGWHNSHHAFPTSARHGLKWWQLDLSFLMIKLLEKFGAVWEIRLPHREYKESA